MRSDYQSIYNYLNLEQKLIVILCKIKPSPEDLDFLSSSLKKSINWEYIYHFSQNNSISSLVYSNILKYAEENVSDDVLQYFREFSIKNTKKNLFLVTVLGKLVHDLNDLGILAVPYKGPALSYLIYNDITIREFTDLDIFVYKKDINQVNEYLLGNSYNPQFNMQGHSEHYYLNSRYYYMNFVRKDGNVAIDLHWASADRNYSFSRPLEYYYEKLQSLEFLNHSYKVHGTEDLFLLLCIHGAKHNWSMFNWTTDLANLVAVKPDIDYEYIMEESDDIGCKSMTAFSLGSLKNLFNLDIPEIKIGLKANKRIEDKRLSLVSYIFRHQINNHKSVSIIPELFDSYADKAYYYLNKYIYPTPIELSMVNLSKRWFFLYFLIRIIRIVYRGIVRII